MMYTDELLNNYRQKYLNVEKALKSKGIFPNRFEPIKTLSLGEELILKVIFSLKVILLTLKVEMKQDQQLTFQQTHNNNK